ncbi:retrovirus-related pol polyprotein from transposon TNT 1-94 [Tanacetum coccineum]|uniref:Retrovirus-related pol polyprotein from transposon TNT 1-94 n=1 Tax=Tanacetum coccineum TaxID=301880 RepID=A0ABQ5I6Z0_9ASTR
MSTLVNTSSTEISVEISVVKQKHDELVKKSLLNRSQFEGQLKEKSKVISDLKVKEGKDIDTMIEMEKQIKFLNEILYKRNQSIQTIHMLAPKCATYNGRSTFANPKYLKKAQSDKPRLLITSVVRQPNAQRIPKPSVLGKPTPFSNSPEMRSFQTKQSVNKTNVSDGLFKPVTQQSLPQNRNQAIRNTNVLETRNEIYMFCERSSGNDLLTGSRDLISTTVSLKKTTSPTPICFMAKASPTQACKAKAVNSKQKQFSSKGRLNLLHMDLCGPMRDDTPEFSKIFSRDSNAIFRAQVDYCRMTRGTEFLNKTLHAYFKEEGIEHQTSTLEPPEQNAQCATQLYSETITHISPTHEKTAYHIINDRKPSIKHLHIFGCTCYITRDGENLDKMKEKGDPCVMVGYSTQSKGYRVYNKRTRLIVESIHIKFDEIKEMMSDHNSSDLAPQRQEMSVENVSSGLVPQGQKASDYDNSDPVPPRQNVVPSAEKTDSSHQGLEFLFSPLLEEYYNPTHGQAEENNNDQAPNASFQEDEFINPFCTRVQEIGESSSRNIDNTDVHSFQPQSHDYRWTRDHPLEQVRGNPTMPVQTRRQLATDPEMCMFALTVSIVEPKNIKEAMADSAWIEAMQDELHQFDRLKV